ncbi:hypothetical protein J4G37_59835, partial [Microvirga sp. 3-52]|nr:hypothetical protein [Microvirga sp. 3-52]
NHYAMDDFSVITATYSAGEIMKGSIAIVGPTRMDYGRSEEVIEENEEVVESSDNEEVETPEEEKDEVEQLKEQIEEEQNKYLRLLADYDNFRRRATLDKEA